MAERTRFGWILTILTLSSITAIIAIVAFSPATIAVKVAGMITVGIVLGVGLIVVSIVLTGIYVLHANSRYDQLNQSIVNSRVGRPQVKSKLSLAALGAALAFGAGPAFAAGPIEAGTQQPLDWTAIIIFAAFVILTLGITYWAAQRTRTAKDFYAAGGGVTGFQNGLAIAGDYMSAASFLGISALVYTGGYYGLIYSIGFLVGWPIIMFLMAEPLRNLGRFTFADVASYRLQATPIRAMAAVGTLVTVAFYLIAQMVGAGQLIKLLFGLPYSRRW